LELLSDNQEHKLPNPQELIENKELEAIIERALESLPAKCRTVFTLKRFGDLNNKEVAEQLNISIKTVENQMTIALRKLTAFINEHWGLAILIAVNHLILFF
jgi:RNA polymerase sigma-70 factor (ECF subfamily)